MNDDSKAKIKTERVADVVPPKPTDIELHLRQRVAQLLLDYVVVHPDRIEIALRADDLYSLVAELQPEEEGHAA